ncbi:hypothetical protein HOY82DRAFT_566660 [Tuber indicum]|nr:hypothetical protein HOY82DRAFT_566660 [Tuber indicum]
MSSRVIVRPDHEGLFQERPLYCPIYECRSFIPQARIDSRGVGTCMRCAAQSCCFCGKLGVHANHLNCPVVIHMMEAQSPDGELADLYRAMIGRRGWAGVQGSAYGNEHVGGAFPRPIPTRLEGRAASAADATINRAVGHARGLVGSLSLLANQLAELDHDQTTGLLNRPMPDPYRVLSTRGNHPAPIIEIPISSTTPAGPVSGSVLPIQAGGSGLPIQAGGPVLSIRAGGSGLPIRAGGPVLSIQAGGSPAPAPAPTSLTTAVTANVDHGRSRPRASDSLRRQMPDLDQIEIQRNRQRFALLRRVRQREYHRVVGSGSTFS